MRYSTPCWAAKTGRPAVLALTSHGRRIHSWASRIASGFSSAISRPIRAPWRTSVAIVRDRADRSAVLIGTAMSRPPMSRGTARAASSAALHASTAAAAPASSVAADQRVRRSDCGTRRSFRSTAGHSSSEPWLSPSPKRIGSMPTWTRPGMTAAKYGSPWTLPSPAPIRVYVAGVVRTTSRGPPTSVRRASRSSRSALRRPSSSALGAAAGIRSPSRTRTRSRTRSRNVATRWASVRVGRSTAEPEPEDGSATAGGPTMTSAPSQPSTSTRAVSWNGAEQTTWSSPPSSSPMA